MTPERWQKVRRILEEAIELAPENRAAFLYRACDGDEVLRSEVAALLEAYDEAGDFIEDYPAELAADLFNESSASLMAGQNLKHYKILSPIGRGGMGEVYLAQDRKLGRKVAIKLLPSMYTKDLDRVARFEQEARAASALNHPNILMVFEIEKTERSHFIVMEFVEGRTLRAVLSERKMSLTETLDVTVQVAAALVVAHKAGVVHRDIKPENIIIRPDGYVKVLDFGLAKLTEKAKPSQESAATFRPAKTESGTILGTANYMSPEQARGQEVDARTDIFSLGGMMYEMLTGIQPFCGETTSDIIAALLLEDPQPLSTFSNDLPVELQRIVSKSLIKDREQRYQTAKDFLRDLKSLEAEMEAHDRLEPSFSSGAKRALKALNSDATQDLAGDLSNRSHKSAETRAVSGGGSLSNQLKRNWRLTIGAFVLLLLATLAIMYFTREQETINSIAVLPFYDQTGDADLEYLGDGIADSLISRLSQISNMKLMSLNSVSRYKGRPVDSKTVGDELRVAAVLIGHIAQKGDDVSIRVELVDARDNTRIWGNQYNRKVSDLMMIQEDIAREISEKLRPSLTGDEQKRIAKNYTENAKAYQLYLKGRFYWNQRTGADIQRAIGFFNQAIELDPSYALAYAGLADCYVLLSNYSGIPPKENLPKAKAAALKAIKIDDRLSEAYASLALVKKDYDWDFYGAEQDFARAIELNPNNGSAYQWRAENFVNLRRLDDAVASMKRAQEIDPFSIIINGEVGWAYYQAHQANEAVEQLRKTVEMEPNFARTYFFLGRAYEQQRKYKEAIEATETALKLSGNYSFYLASLGHIYGRAGRENDTRRILMQLEERSKNEYVSPMAFALIHTSLSEPDKAFYWLEKAYEMRDAILGYYLRDPQLESLATDERLNNLAERMGLSR
jgi:serine/threonine protein kinase/Flp pilus assembly protein TadD